MRKLICPACLSLHVLLVAIYITFLSIWARKAEYSLVMSPQRAESVPTYTSLISQVIMIPYTALLVLLTQSLALRGLVTGRHTLTSVQDVASAWTGLGSALLTTWKQASSPSYVLGLVEVALYLVCISSLHVTTPSLFAMQSFNQTGAEITVPVTLGMPHLNISTNWFSFPDSEGPWPEATSYLPTTDQSSILTIGLVNSTIYDIIGPDSGLVEAYVNATTANVTCGCIPNATAQYVEDTGLSGPIESTLAVSVVYGRYNLTFEYYPNVTMFPVSNAMNLQYMTTVDYGIQRSNSMYNNASSAVTIPMGRNALFWTTLNLVGDNGESVSQIKGNISNQTSLIGCTLGWEQSIVTLDAATRQPVGLTSATDVTRRPSACAIWEPALLIDSMGIDPLIDSWAYMLVGSAQSAEYPTGIGGSGIAYEQGADSALYLESALGNPHADGTVSLKDFEEALGRMTAAAYWSATHVVGTTSWDNNTLSIRSGIAQGSRAMFHLKLNVAPVAAGLAASIVLLLIAIDIVLKAKRSTPLIAEFGPMQLMWLVCNNDVISQRLAEVEVPSVENLRRAGMVDLEAPIRLSSNMPARGRYLGLAQEDTASPSQRPGRNRELWVYIASQ